MTTLLILFDYTDTKKGDTLTIGALGNFGTQNDWKLNPHTKQKVEMFSIIFTVDGKRPGNYSGYVNIKTNSHFFVVLVEISLQDVGLYTQPDILDFGIFTTHPTFGRSSELWLINNGVEDILVTNITSDTLHDNLFVDLSTINLPVVVSPGGLSRRVVAGTISYLPPFRDAGKHVGKILVYNNHSSNPLLTIPWKVKVVRGDVGGVAFVSDLAYFYVPVRNTSEFDNVTPINSLDTCLPRGVMRRVFSFTNHHETPVTGLAISTPSCGTLLQVATQVAPSTIVGVLESWPNISVDFDTLEAKRLSSVKNIAPGDGLIQSCWLELVTNISTLRIPLYILDGSIELAFMDAVSPTF